MSVMFVRNGANGLPSLYLHGMYPCLKHGVHLPVSMQVVYLYPAFCLNLTRWKLISLLLIFYCGMNRTSLVYYFYPTSGVRVPVLFGLILQG